MIEKEALRSQGLPARASGRESPAPTAILLLDEGAVQRNGRMIVLKNQAVREAASSLFGWMASCRAHPNRLPWAATR